MNKARRKEIDSILATLIEIDVQIMYLEEDETEAYYNIPESLKESEKATKMSEGIDHLYSARMQLEEVLESLRQAQGQ